MIDDAEGQLFCEVMELKIWHLLVLVFLLFMMNLHNGAFVKAQSTWSCGDKGNYTAGGAYGANLQSAFASIVSNMGDYGFSNTSVGLDPERVTATGLCRTDLQLEDCRSCIKDGITEITQNCPLNKEAILWKDYCTLRYSNEYFLGTLASSPRSGLMAPWSFKNTTLEEFKADLKLLLDDVRNQAANGGPLLKVATGNRSAPDFKTLYALLQCTPDISGDDCHRCLDSAAVWIPDCCEGRGGVRSMWPSCTLRFETVLFYNLSRIQEVEALLAPPPPLPSPTTISSTGNPPKKVDHSDRIIPLVVSGVVAAIILIGGLVFFLVRKQMKKQYLGMGTTAYDDGITIEETLEYDFDEIKNATNGFSETNKIGEGGFGAVYKGSLKNGKEIAVKRLRGGSPQGDVEFKNEVLLLARLQHRNLVKLIGFAVQRTERLLIYEFMKNGSLNNFIFDPTNHTNMDWGRRYKIIFSIAKGLLYLHEDSRFRIIHRDLKASNVLLDDNMEPKIADFGTARLIEIDETEGSTSRIVGTYGYMPPEYIFHGVLSVKLDVFSFGVLVLEIVSGRQNRLFINAGKEEKMLSFAWKKWQEGAAEQMIDPKLMVGLGSLQQVLKCIHIALLCIQENAADRPTMASVVLMLNSSSITMPIPQKPAFSGGNTAEVEASWASPTESSLLGPR